MKTAIMDNLKVTLRNIHIRIENKAVGVDHRVVKTTDEKSLHRFSAGLTLYKLEVLTVGANGEPEVFFDRSANKGQPLRKVLRLEHLGVYFCVDEENFVLDVDGVGERERFIEERY
jgi:hypothetical protein